jgi:hypothetical protein
MPEITITDLVTWEPRLRLHESTVPGSALEFDRSALEREVTWAVSVRATEPMLPPLRSGELVIIPSRVIADAVVSLQDLLREIASRGGTGVIFDVEPLVPSPLPVLVVESIPADFESDLNRLLTEQRGEIYRAGTELGRILTHANSIGSDVVEVLNAAAEYLGFPVAIIDPSGSMVAITHPDASPPSKEVGRPLSGGRGWCGDHFGIRLSGGETLWLGPVEPEGRALTRVVGERVGVAAEAALTRSLDMRPRGAARSAALAGLLTATSSDAARAAATLGLSANGTFRIALAAGSTERLAFQRALSPFGVIHEAGLLGEDAAALIELRSSGTRSGSEGSRVVQVNLPEGAEWLALSGPVVGTASLPEAARQARFVSVLLESGQVRGPVARFELLSDLGVYRLLYLLWGSPELDAFAADALGQLARRDKRSVLRKTLLAYLESGGSQVEAAARLGIHRNTLAYRLKQIAALSSIEPSSPSSQLALHLALVAGTIPPPADGHIPFRRGAFGE